MSGIRVALVRNLENMNSELSHGDLQHLENAMSAVGIHFDIQAWDDPNVNWSIYSHIILTSHIYYFLNIDNFLLWVSRIKNMESDEKPKLWNSTSTILWNYNKNYLLELELKGIRIPITVLLNGSSTVSQSLTDEFKVFVRCKKDAVNVVVKNAVDGGGFSVWRSNLKKSASGTYVMESSDMNKLQEQLLSPKGKFGVLIQEFLPAIQKEGEWSLMYFNRKFSHAVLKKPPPSKNVDDSQDENSRNNEFRVQNLYGGSFSPVPEDSVPKNLISFSDRLLQNISGPLLHARVDIVNSEVGDPCLMELEVLDAELFITEPAHGERYLNAILNV